jgi:hypothetical protein
MSFQHPSTKIEASQIIFHRTSRPEFLLIH